MKTQITNSIETITPERAAVMLRTANVDNRRLRMHAVQSMAGAMRRGEWITTHQGIAFTQSGRLVDGQHRLSAIVLAEMPIDMMVSYGLPDDAFKVLDRGIKRSIEDVTGLEKRLAEAVSFAGRIAHGTPASAAQLLSIVDSGFGAAHEDLMKHCGLTRKTVSAAPVRTAAVVMVMDGQPSDEVCKLYRQLCTAEHQSAPSVWSLLRQIADGKATAKNSNDLLCRSLKALNPRNTQLSKVQISEAEITQSIAYVRRVIRGATEGGLSA
jgi:hypothetical protein